MECAMKRRFLAVLLAGVLAFSNMGAVLAADVSGSGSTDAEETFAAEESAEDEGSEAPEEEGQDAGALNADTAEADAGEAEEEAVIAEDNEEDGLPGDETPDGTEPGIGSAQEDTEAAEEPADPDGTAREEDAEAADAEVTAQEETDPAQETADAAREEAQIIGEAALEETSQETSAYVEPVEDYEREWDRRMLPGWDGTVRGSYNVYIENDEYPDGHNESYSVTNVEIVRDDPWEGEDGDVIVDFHRDENGEDDYWWYYRVGHHGEAVLKVTYEDLRGEEKSYEFTLSVGGDVYSVSVLTDGYMSAFPGDEIEIWAEGRHQYFDEDGEYHSDDDGLSYVWSFDEGEDLGKILVDPNDSSRATVKFNKMPSGQHEIRELVWIRLDVLDADGNRTEASERTGLWVSTDYIDVYPMDLDRGLEIGGSLKDVTYETRRYIYGISGYSVIDNSQDVTYRWDYDENAVSITEVRNGKTVEIGDGGNGTGRTFTITRKGDWPTDYRVHALWTDENGEPRDNWNNYLFEDSGIELRFEEHDVDLYTDDPAPRELVLNTEELGDGWQDRLDLEIIAGVWDDEEYTEMLGSEDYTVSTGGDEVRVTLQKAYLEKIEDFRNVRVEACTYLKGDEKTEENRLRQADAWFHIHVAKEEYDREGDRTMLPGWDGTVDGSRNVYIENSEWPDGRDDRYFVTDVQVVSDEPWEGEDGKVIAELHRDENGEDDYWWYYRVENRGKATLKVTYKDLQGQTQSYEFTLSVGNDVYNVYMDSEGRVRNAFPGGEIELYADANHEYMDENGDHQSDFRGLGYQWGFEQGEEFAEIVPHDDDPSRATLKFRELPDDRDWIDEHVRVGVRILDADGNETEGYDSTGFWVRSDYTEVWPLELDRGMDVGASIKDEKFEVRRYTYGEEDYEVLDDKYGVTYEWHYDQNILSIKEKKGGKEVEVGDGNTAAGRTFTFLRKGDWNSDFSVRATWKEKNGEERDAWGNYQLWDRNYDFWYEIYGNDTVYSDGSRTYGFNLDNLQGVDFKLVPEVGNGEWREGKGFEEPVAEGNGWKFDHDNNLITFDGEALSAAGIDHIETRISLQIGGVEVKDEWRGFNVEEAREDFWDLHDDVLFIDDERYFGRNGRCFIKNTQFPDGEETDYTITSMTYESDEDPFDTRDAVEVTKEGDGWKFRAVRGGEEQVHVKLRVNGGIEDSVTREYETSFKLIVGGRRFYMGLFTETGGDRLQSGKEIKLIPDINGEEYDWETGDRHEIDTSGFRVNYEVNCWHVADRIIEERYDGDFEKASARGELWDYVLNRDGSIVVKSLDKESYEIELEVRAMLIDPESGEECASTSRQIFIDRVIYEMRLLNEKGKEFDWNEELPPGAEVKLTPQVMRNALDGDCTPVQKYTDVTYRLNWYEGNGEEYDPDHIEVSDKNGNKLHPGDEIKEEDGPITVKRNVVWDFDFNIDASWTEDEDWENGIGIQLRCDRVNYSDGFTWNSERGDGGYTWYYTAETVDIKPDRMKLDSLAKEGYPVKTTVELGFFERGQIKPIIKYAIDENGRRGEAQGEYDTSGIFSAKGGLQASGAQLEELYEVLRYQDDVWGDIWGRLAVRIHSELNGVVLADYILRVTLCRPYLEISGFKSEMGVGQVQTFKDGKAELYLEDVDHDDGIGGNTGDYFDIVITGIELKDAKDAQYVKVEKDGADFKITALKVSVKKVPLKISFTGGPDGYTSCEASVTVSKGVFEHELRDKDGEKVDDFGFLGMLIGEKQKLVPYVTYTEGGKVTEVPAKKGGQYYYTVDYTYYDERMIDADAASCEITALRDGSSTIDITITVWDKNGNQCNEMWTYVTINSAASRGELTVPEDAVLRVKPGESFTAQQILDAVKPVFTVYSMKKPEGATFPISHFGLEEVIGKEDELFLAEQGEGEYGKLNVGSNATEGEAILIVHAVGGYGIRASAGLKVAVEVSSKEEQVLTCDTSTPAVVNNQTLEYTVEGGKGALTCEVADPSVATATVSGDKIKVKGLKAGNTKLIVRAAETNDYAAAEQEFDLKVITLGKTRRGDMFNLAGTVKVTWEPVPGAIWYKVYRSGKAEPVIVTKALIGYDNTEGMIPGEKYTYKIVASTTGKDKDGKIVSGGESPLSYSKVMYRLKTVAWKYVKNTQPGKVLASYQKSPYGDSYVLLYADNEAMNGAKSKVIFGSNTTSCLLGGFKKGRTYWFQIRVRKKVNGIDYYTTFGAKKKVVITK